MLTVALSHLLTRGVRLETHEAVALTRELLARPCACVTLENIQLHADGSACCASPPGVPSVASVAHLLLTLLPAGTPDVPAPLRYAIARGLGAVEAAPFGSLGEFWSALEPFEKGSSREVLRGLLQRGARPARPLPAPIAAMPTPPTPVPATPSPLARRPHAVPGSTPVVRKPPAASNESRQPTASAASPPMFRSFGADGAADSSAYSSRRWALPSAAALVAAFTLGYAVADRLTDRAAATPPSGPARMSPAPASNGSLESHADVELRYEIVRVPNEPVSEQGREPHLEPTP